MEDDFRQSIENLYTDWIREHLDYLRSEDKGGRNLFHGEEMYNRALTEWAARQPEYQASEEEQAKYDWPRVYAKLIMRANDDSGLQTKLLEANEMIYMERKKIQAIKKSLEDGETLEDIASFAHVPVEKVEYWLSQDDGKEP